MSTGRGSKSDGEVFAELAEELAERLARLGHRGGQIRAQLAREIAVKFRTWSCCEPTAPERDQAVGILRELHETAIELEKGSR